MNRILRRALGVCFGLVGLLFLGSVACPPLSERHIPDSPGRLDLGDPLRQATPAEADQRVFVSESSPASSSSAQAFLAQVRDRDSQLSVSAPSFLLAGQTRVRGLVADADGVFSLPLMGEQPQILQASAEGYFPKKQEATPGAVCVFLLRPAASISGKVEIRPGQKAIVGVLALQATASSVPPILLHLNGPTGTFASPLLEPGEWILSYRTHSGDQAEQGPRAVLNLSGGRPMEVLVQLNQNDLSGNPATIRVQN